MKAVVTGAAGFLGSELSRQLIREGYQVIAIDNLSTGLRERLQDLEAHPSFQFIKADVSSPEIADLENVQGVEEIYHLASPASPRFYQAYPLETIAANTLGTKRMLDLARAWNAKLLYTSTSEVYGDPEVHPQSEEYRGHVTTMGPRACYDESKRLGEVYCYEYYSRWGVRVAIARLFNTYSAALRNDDGRVISNLVTQALTSQPMTVYGDGSQTRSFCYIDDTIRGLRSMMREAAADGEVINLGNPGEISILDLARLIRKLAGSDSPIIFRPLPKDDPKQRNPRIDKAIKLLNWRPSVTLEEGLRRTIAAYRSVLSKEGAE